jgi:hypothetical protein
MYFMKRFTAIALSAVILMALFQTGCSVIGLTVGSIHDSRMRKRNPISTDSLETLKTGTAVKLTLEDGTHATGRYAGLEFVPEKTYEAWYSSFLKKEPAGPMLPALGDSVTVQYFLKDRPETILITDGVLCGFGASCFLIENKGFFPRSDVPYSVLQKMTDSKGHSFTKDSITNLIAGKKIPVMDGIRIQGRTGIETIPMQKILEIRRQNTGNTAAQMFFGGLVFDLAVFLIIQHAMNHMMDGFYIPL